MKRSTATMMILLLVSTTACFAGQGEQPVILPPSRAVQQSPPGAIDTRPFGALETRPLWDRPTNDSGLTLQGRTERALDRGNGRVEDQATFDLRQLERERVGGTELGSAWERAQMDREDQVEQLRLQAQREGMRQERIERESEALAATRRQWQSVLTRENAAGGAVIDRQALDAVEREYQSSLSAASHKRVQALAAAGNDRDKRGAAQREYEAAKAAAMNTREQKRGVIFGTK